MEKLNRVFAPVYDQNTEKLISNEFQRVRGTCYLEHSGATLYSEKQIADVQKELCDGLFANPHARSTSSKLTGDAIDQVRFQILQHYHTTSEEYSVVFTSGATAALKLVAETFDYSGGRLVYLQDNHTSVLGMRQLSGNSNSISYKEATTVFNENSTEPRNSNGSNSLFVYPAQCNFSGLKYPTSWIDQVKSGILDGASKWYCMLDAASYVSSNDLDLSKIQPDFLCVSFYKIFGYPTGVGALLIRNDSAGVLSKKYFGGGTVYMALSSQKLVVPREGLHERFEDGTLSFLSIIALRHGFATLKRLNLDMELISRHTYSLARYVYEKLSSLRHANGERVCVLYHDTKFDDVRRQAGIVNFNMLRDDGSHFGYSEVMHIANLSRIQLRTGCFCNPGACQRHLGLSDEDVKYHFEQGHVCGDQHDLIDGKPTGSVRISFGYMSTLEDADYFLKVMSCFVTLPLINKASDKLISNNDTKTGITNSRIAGKLESVYLYPIKSCGPYTVQSSWQLVETGLKYDREWMIVNASNVCLTQKNEPRMCVIRPIVNINDGKLILTSKGFRNISVPLDLDVANNAAAPPCHSKVCMDSVLGWDCGDEVSKWLHDVLGVEGLRLLKQCATITSRISKKGDGKPQLSLANKAQFLLINKASAQWLLNCVPEDSFRETVDELIARFRPNFVVDFQTEHLENNCQRFEMGNITFTFEGKCTRCQMICIDQTTGEKSVEPLRTISREFKGKINFGVYLKQTEHCTGDTVKIGAVINGW